MIDHGSEPAGGSGQITRIARLLGVHAGEVTGLDGLSEAQLRRLHDQIGAALFADGRPRFARIAGLSAVLPAPMVGKLAERFLAGELAARAVELLAPKQARELADRVSVGYLADICAALDPVRARPVLRAIRPARIEEVARELCRRGEYAAMAGFVGAIDVEALTAVVHGAAPRDLLALLPLVEWDDDLVRIVEGLPETQVRRIVAELDPSEVTKLIEYVVPLRLRPAG